MSTSKTAELTQVAVYRRTVGASLERVWENVHDWEHLPWLHDGSFADIELLESGDWGWKARTTPRNGSSFVIELRREPDRERYCSKTLDGPGAGTEIWTGLVGAGDHATDVEVSFLVPGVAEESAAGLGRMFLSLYERLWDEDEAMMQRRESELARGRELSGRQLIDDPIELGPLDELREKLPLSVDVNGRPYRVVEIDGQLCIHSVVCPHLLGPLDVEPDEEGCVRCPWHGYRFDVRSGESAEGRALRLAPAPHIDIDAAGRVRLTRRSA
jgi:nitrite reductase/ring-hydroxylating ferredoxin subunit